MLNMTYILTSLISSGHESRGQVDYIAIKKTDTYRFYFKYNNKW